MSHSLTKEDLRAPKHMWGLLQAFASRINHIAKSGGGGVKPGYEGGHLSFAQNPGRLSLHHFCEILEVCDSAPSCWKLYGSDLK